MKQRRAVQSPTMGRLAVALCGLLFAASGCSQQSPYVSGYSFYPQPAVVDVVQRGAAQPMQQAQQTPLTVLASVLGIRRADPKHSIPESVAVRLRFENNGTSRVTFDPHSLELVTGTLQAFMPPITTPSYPIEIAPGQRQEVNAYFPFPPNMTASQMNLQNLRLRWEVRIDNYPVIQTALFQRAPGGTPNEYETPASPSPSPSWDVY